jgi:hypothetical protein
MGLLATLRSPQIVGHNQKVMTSQVHQVLLIAATSYQDLLIENLYDYNVAGHHLATRKGKRSNIAHGHSHCTIFGHYLTTPSERQRDTGEGTSIVCALKENDDSSMMRLSLTNLVFPAGWRGDVGLQIGSSACTRQKHHRLALMMHPSQTSSQTVITLTFGARMPTLL